MRRARKPAPVYYADLRELVFHAAEAFPDTRFFPSGDAAMPYVTGRELKAFTGALGAWAARRGLQGKHIAILGQNGAAWISCFFAALGAWAARRGAAPSRHEDGRTHQLRAPVGQRGAPFRRRQPLRR